MTPFLLTYGSLIGYILLFLGALLEGETVVITAGYFAFKGYLSIFAVIGIAFLGTITADQVLFFVGRRQGAALLERHPNLQKKSTRVFALLHRFQNYYILCFRFIYGIRIASPLIIGASGISIKRYIVLDLVAACIWCPLMAGLGYSIGYFLHEPIEMIVKRILNYERMTVAIVALGILGIGAAYYLLLKQKNRKP